MWTTAAIDASTFGFVALAGFVATLAGAYTSLRLLGPQRAKVVADTKNTLGQEADRLVGRWKEYAEHAEAQLVEARREMQSCRIEVREVARRERECEERAEAQEERIAHLEAVLRRHQLNGD